MTKIRGHAGVGPPAAAQAFEHPPAIQTCLDKKRAPDPKNPLTVSEVVAFIQTFNKLSPSAQRHAQLDLIEAARAGGQDIKKLPRWKNASLEACASLLGTKEVPTDKADLEKSGWDQMMQLWRLGKEIDEFRPQSNKSPEDRARLDEMVARHEQLKRTHSEFQTLRFELNLAPKPKPLANTDVLVEVDYMFNPIGAPGCAGVGAGVYLGHKPDPENPDNFNNRTFDPFVAAPAGLPLYQARGVLSKDHHGIERGPKMPGVGVSHGDPYFGDKVTTSAYLLGVSTAPGGGLGGSVELPISLFGLDALFFRPKVSVMVRDPRLEPQSAWVVDKKEKLTAKAKDKSHKAAVAMGIPTEEIAAKKQEVLGSMKDRAHRAAKALHIGPKQQTAEVAEPSSEKPAAADVAVASDPAKAK